MAEGEKMPTISGGLFNSKYALDSFHFHWGHNNSLGSEHVINHNRYPIEMHIVHRNTKYSTLDEAGGYEDGIVVLALFYHIAEWESPALENLIDSLLLIEAENQHVVLHDTFPMDSLFTGINTDNFYTYRGTDYIRKQFFVTYSPILFGILILYRIANNSTMFGGCEVGAIPRHCACYCTTDGILPFIDDRLIRT